VIEELVGHYKKWKFGVNGRFENASRTAAAGPIPTWPFLEEAGQPLAKQAPEHAPQAAPTAKTDAAESDDA
jgi:hypothetical protein